MADPIGYFEVAGPDPQSLAAFYSGLFGWSSQPGPLPGYVTVDAGPGVSGGFRREDGPERVLYIRVSDLHSTLERIVAAGGKVLIPPTDVPGVVRFALFEDPQGNRMGLII